MNIQTHEFKNGFKLVYQKSTHRTQVTCLNVFCDMGPIYEDTSFRGVSHMIEHMCYKGTTHKNAYSLFTLFDEHGAYTNASTYKRYTTYNVNCVDKHIKLCIHYLSDMLLNSTFGRKEFEKEHQVIIEENIKDNEDNINILSDMNDKIIYKNTPFEFPIDCIEYHKPNMLKHKDVIRRYQQFYIPGNMLISVVSNLSFDFFVKVLRQTHFHRENNTSDLHAYKMGILQKYFQPVLQNGIQYHIKPDPKIMVTNLSISFRTCSQYSEDKYVLELISNLLGGYFSSRLFMVLREENGLTYSNTVSSNNNEFCGDFTITTITEPSKFIKNGNKKGVLPIIIDILCGIIIGNITPREFNIAKNNLDGQYTLDMNDMDKVCIYNGEHLLLYPGEKHVSYQNMYDTFYKSITLKDVNRVIRKYFTHTNMNVCVLGEINVSEKTIQNICEKIAHI